MHTISNNNSWYLYYKSSTDSLWDSIQVNDTTYQLQGLTQNTQYNYYLKTICTDTLSVSSSIQKFRTNCGVITTLPFTENFDAYGTGESSYPYCWSKNTTNNYPYVTQTNYSSPGSLYMNASIGQKVIAITPEFDVTIPVNTLKANLKLRKPTVSNSILVVGVMSDITDSSTFEPVDTIAPSLSATWQDFMVNFSSYQGAATHIAFISEATDVA